MNTDSLSQLEKLCRAPIPSACQAVLTNYPEILRHAVRADDGSDAEGFVSEAELLADTAEVLRINREVRQHSILDPEGREFSWPSAFLVIGETGDGDYYCVDTAGEHEGVLQFRHHTVEFDTVADSVEEFLEILVESYVEDFGDEEALENDDEFDDDEDLDEEI